MHILDKNAIIERLKNFRESREISARQFAVEADIDQSHYSKVENGKMPVTEKMLVKFFNRYPELDRDYILYGRSGSVFYDGLRAAAANAQPGAMPAMGMENNVIDVVNSLLSLAPPVSPVLPLQQQIFHFKDRESKLMMAIELLKATIGNLQNEVDQLQQKSKNKERENY